MQGKTERVAIPGHTGLNLAGVLHSPEGSVVKGTLVFCHCFTCSKDYKLLVWLARELVQEGYCVLRFDFTGLGDSEGEFRDSTLSTDIQDLIEVVNWLESRGNKVVGLLGHSLGGTVAILGAGQISGVQPVVVLGTSHDPDRVTRLLDEESWQALQDQGCVSVRVGGQELPFSQRFVQDLKVHSLKETVSLWDKALLIVHGTADRIVPLSSAEELFEAAKYPKALVSIPGADHLFVNDRSQAPNIATIIDQWVQLNGDK
jgi:alpha-beta hydrolase superfamily lysophospholipase